MNKKQKLELTWVGKDVRPRLEPRILVEDPEKSYHAAHRVKEWPQENARNTKDSDSLRSLRSFAAKNPDDVGDIFDNRLIFGDNLLALKALEQEFTGKIKDLDRRIKEARRTAVIAVTLEEKITGQKQIKALEAQRSQRRRTLFDAQDEVDLQRERLIANIEGKLTQRADLKPLFTLRWRLQ